MIDQTLGAKEEDERPKSLSGGPGWHREGEGQKLGEKVEKVGNGSVGGKKTTKIVTMGTNNV